MNAFEKIVYALSKRVPTPVPFGTFHLIWLAVVILFTVALCVFFRNSNEKTIKRIILISWICMVIGEIYKQVVFSLSVTDGVASWAYKWHHFPFQLCATPLYVFPLSIFCRGKFQKFINAYISTFSLFGGLVVMIYPGDVFTATLGVNIQTMIHHGLQVAIGILLAINNRKELSFRNFLQSIPVFAVAVGSALILNIVVYNIFAAQGGEIPGFNMFYISPYFPCTLPLVSLIYPIVPYPVFLLIYIIGFTVAALAVYYAIFGIYRLVLKVFNNEKQNN